MQSGVKTRWQWRVAGVLLDEQYVSVNKQFYNISPKHVGKSR